MNDFLISLDKILNLMGEDDSWYEKLNDIKTTVNSDDSAASSKALNKFLDYFGGMMSLNDYTGQNPDEVRAELSRIYPLIKDTLRQNWKNQGNPTHETSTLLSDGSEVSLRLGDIKLKNWQGDDEFVNEDESTGSWFVKEFYEYDITGAPIYTLARTLDGPGSGTTINARAPH